jgi:hypothetical protein
MSQPRTVIGSLLLVTALALAGCGSGGAASPAAAPTGTTGTPEAPGSPAATAVPGAGTATPSSTAPTAKAALNPRTCGNADLRLAAGRTDAAMGHVGVVLLFRNTASTPCHLRGYPGVAGLDASGRQVAQASRTPTGYLGGLASGGPAPSVTVAAGGTASALVEATDVPTGAATACPSYAALLVIPPNDTAATRLPVTLPGCSGLEVHPVVTGGSGSR